VDTDTADLLDKFMRSCPCNPQYGYSCGLFTFCSAQLHAGSILSDGFSVSVNYRFQWCLPLLSTFYSAHNMASETSSLYAKSSDTLERCLTLKIQAECLLYYIGVH